MIELRGVGKEYLYGTRLFGALDLTLGDGEILAVLGRTGDGRTSFLKTLAGLGEYEGEILLDNSPANAKTDDVIMLFDDCAVFPTKSVFDNLAYPLKIRKFDKTDIAARVIRAAETMEIGACLNMRASRLSLGEKKRMAAARLLLRDAKLLLIDDVTSGLTADEAGLLWGLLSKALVRIAEKGTTVVYSTSSAAEAISISDRIAVLHSGEIKQLACASEILTRPRSIWAVEALDGDYNVRTAGLYEHKGELKLDFGELYGQLNIECLRGKMAPEYVGKEVYCGWRAGECATGEPERVVFARGIADGFILETESGVRAFSRTKADKVKPLPRPEAAVLFDRANENSIMRTL